jgi:predicted GIY-YIG superfamily endonuclease
MTTALYRHFDALGTLLYVGISNNHLRRLAQHQEGAKWAEQIARVAIERFPTRQAALEAESQAIALYRDYSDVTHMLEFYASELPDTVFSIVPWGGELTEQCRALILGSRRIVGRISWTQ